MRVLLITTGEHSVTSHLKCSLDWDTCVIQCPPLESLESRIDEALAQYSPDIIVTYRCPKILPSRIMSAAPLGAYNIHPSLLPKYPGLNPWDEMFKNRERQGGVTLHQLSGKVDAGPIVCQQAFEIKSEDTFETARNNADRIAAEMLCSFLSQLKMGHQSKATTR